VFVLYCVFANPAFGCLLPINDDDVLHTVRIQWMN